MLMSSLPLALSISLIALALGAMLIIKAKKHKELGTLCVRIVGYIVVIIAFLNIISSLYCTINIMTAEKKFLFNFSADLASEQMQRQQSNCCCKHMWRQAMSTSEPVQQNEGPSAPQKQMPNKPAPQQNMMMNDQMDQNHMSNSPSMMTDNQMGQNHMGNGSSMMMNNQMGQNHMSNGSSMMMNNGAAKKTNDQPATNTNDSNNKNGTTGNS